MVLATKERIIADRQFATERYILSTMPVLYLPLHRLDSGSSGGKFISVDGAGSVCTVTGALLSQGGRIFDGDDLINIGAQFNSVSTLWISIWFKFTATFDTGEDAVQIIFGKLADGTNYLDALFDNIDGKLKFRSSVGGTIFEVETVEISWAAGVWQHVLFSISATNGVNMIVNNGVPVTDADTSAIVSGGDFVFGARTDPPIPLGFEGTIGEVIVSRKDITPLENQENYLATEWRYR